MFSVKKWAVRVVLMPMVFAGLMAWGQVEVSTDQPEVVQIDNAQMQAALDALEHRYPYALLLKYPERFLVVKRTCVPGSPCLLWIEDLSADKEYLIHSSMTDLEAMDVVAGRATGLTIELMDSGYNVRVVAVRVWHVHPTVANAQPVAKSSIPPSTLPQGVGQSSDNPIHGWTITSQTNEMTSQVDYTFHSFAVSPVKADFQIHCTGATWKSTEIVLDRPVESRYIWNFFIMPEIRLDDGAPYYDKLFVENDMRTISLTDLNHPRRFVRAKKIVIQYQTVGGENTVVVFEPPVLDPTLSKTYCGADPQDILPLRLTLLSKSTKRVYDNSDWIECVADDGPEKEIRVGTLPFAIEATSTITISVGNKATMNQLIFDLNGLPMSPEWRSVKDGLIRFTTTVHP